ncbi:MAG: hypothetical protein WC692_08985 [Erythrobacter sp.]
MRLGIVNLAISDYIAITLEWSWMMGSVTIRNLDDAIKQSARLAAAKNGRSLEAELRALLERTYSDERTERVPNIHAMSGREAIEHLIRVGGGAGIDLPERSNKTADPFDAG